MKTIETYLPIFNGFYNTQFEPDGEDDEIQDINSNRKNPITYEDCDWDYETYRNEVAENCCDAIDKQLKEALGSGVNVKFQALISPKYYNYSNDSINVEITLDNKAIKHLQTHLLENFDEFEGYIDEYYSSYDGFISSHSNDATTWIFEYFSQIETNGHYLGAILEFLLLEYYSVEDLVSDIGNPSVHAKNYNELCEG